MSSTLVLPTTRTRRYATPPGRSASGAQHASDTSVTNQDGHLTEMLLAKQAVRGPQADPAEFMFNPAPATSCGSTQRVHHQDDDQRLTQDQR